MSTYVGHDIIKRPSFQRDRGTHLLQNTRKQPTWLSGRGRPIWHAHRTSGDHRGAQEWSGVRQIRLHHYPFRQLQFTMGDLPMADFWHLSLSSSPINISHCHTNVRHAGKLATGMFQIESVR